jgi:hypothetical protein
MMVVAKLRHRSMVIMSTECVFEYPTSWMPSTVLRAHVRMQNTDAIQ